MPPKTRVKNNCHREVKNVETNRQQQAGVLKRKTQKLYYKKAKYYHEKERKHNLTGIATDFDTEEYLLHVLHINWDDINSNEREIYSSNVFQELADKEIQLSCTRVGSDAMEKILAVANEATLLRCANAFLLNLETMFQNKYGSHVLQKLISIVSTFLEERVGTPHQLRDWILQVGLFTVENLLWLVQDIYANHVVRTLLECFSGLPAKLDSHQREWKRDSEKKSARATVVVPEFYSIVEMCGKEVVKWPNLQDLPFTAHTSAFLQALIFALNTVKKKARCLLMYLLDHCFSWEIPPETKGKIPFTMQLPAAFCSQPATRLLDVMIEISSRKLFNKILLTCFLNKLKMLSLAPGANFCVQKMLLHCSNSSEFELMFDELGDHLELLLCHQRTGVVLALAQGCTRLATRQHRFLELLAAALHCAHKESLALVVAQLVPQKSAVLRISLHGSLIVQTMLNFTKPIKVVRSLLALEATQLEAVACDRCGSHIVDAFVESVSVGEKSRERLLLKLQGSFVRMAVSTHGSHSLEALYCWAPVKLRVKILEELAQNEAIVMSHQCGSILADKFALSVFKKKRNAWEQLQGQWKRKRKLFEEICQ